MARKRPREERIINPEGRRHFRKRYSLTEVHIGAVLLVLLAAIVGWVFYRGQHPDPELFKSTADLLIDSNAQQPADRGPLPASLNVAGFTESSFSVFDSTNLYVKINGREDYYKSFGFERLYFVALVGKSSSQTLDLELFDLGTAENALGAYAGERQGDAQVSSTDTGLWHVAQNALFATHGRYYARVIGSDVSPETIAALKGMHHTLLSNLEASPLPWGFRLLVGQLAYPPSAVGFFAENAFSFEQGRGIFTGKVPNSDAELFVTVRDDEEQASTLVAALNNGFAAMGEAQQAGWIKHRYLGTFARAAHHGPWVYGIRDANSVVVGEQALKPMQKKLQALDEAFTAEAQKEVQTYLTSGPQAGDKSNRDAQGGGEDPMAEAEAQPVEEY